MELAWSTFKVFINDRALSIQYADDGQTYYLWATDGVLLLQCRIVQDGGSDQTDFETNYEPAANSIVSEVATSANQDSEISLLSSVDSKITAVNTGSVTVSSSALPTGAATDTKQDTGNTTLTNIHSDTTSISSSAATTNTKLTSISTDTSSISTNVNTVALRTPALGQAAMTASVPVVIASNQSAVPVTATNAVATNLKAQAEAYQGGSAVGSGNPLQVTLANTTANSTAVKVDGSAVTQPASIADGSLTTLGAKADAKSTATDTTSISAMSVLKQISASVQAPPSQAVTNAGTFAVQAAEADGANVTLGAKADAKSTATDTTAVSVMSVLKQISASSQAPPSSAVTNAGTFAVQAALNAETTKVIGTVNIASGQSLAANQSVNVAQINGVTPLMGNGTTGTGSPRVTIASDNTAFAVNATLQASSGTDIGKLTANQSINVSQVNGGTAVASVTGVQDVMPRKRSGSTGLSPTYYAAHITTKTTTTPTSSTCYVSSVVISCSAAGSTWTFKIQDKSGTPLILVPAFTLTVPTNLPLVISLTEPILMTSGIDIVTAGTTAGTVDVWITYWS